VSISKPNFVDFLTLVRFIGCGKLKSTLNYSALAPNVCAANAFIDWQLLLCPENSDNQADLGFKQQYPDINHTPGMRLLSNGVGLTSPPVENSPVYAQPKFPDFRKTIHQVIEDKHLHMMFANFDIGTISSKASRKDSQFDSIHGSEWVLRTSFVRSSQQSCLEGLLQGNYVCLLAGSDLSSVYAICLKTALPSSNLIRDRVAKNVIQVLAPARDGMQVATSQPDLLHQSSSTPPVQFNQASHS
jgi:hypothetical protein